MINRYFTPASIFHLLLATLCFTLAACGGGGGSDEPDYTPTVLTSLTLTVSTDPDFPGLGNLSYNFTDGSNFTETVRSVAGTYTYSVASKKQATVVLSEPARTVTVAMTFTSTTGGTFTRTITGAGSSTDSGTFTLN